MTTRYFQVQEWLLGRWVETPGCTLPDQMMAARAAESLRFKHGGRWRITEVHPAEMTRPTQILKIPGERFR